MRDSFTLLRYARDEWPTFFLAAFFLLVATVALLAAGISLSWLTVVLIAAAGCCVACFFIRYSRRRRFYRELSRLSESADCAWQCMALLDQPDFVEGQVAWSALRRMGKAMSDEVDAEREDAARYREFVELWVHEAKAPLAAALLASERCGGEEASTLRLQLERIDRQINRALYYARSTSLSNDFLVRRVSLRAVCAQACKDNARFLIEKRCIPCMDVPESCHVFTDEKWLRFIVSQAVVNAAQYGAGSVRFTAETIRCGTADEAVRFQIADNGKGIVASDVPRVFDRGFTGETGRAAGSSTGMGLYLVAVMCEKMCIGVTIGSEEGVGTRLIFDIPNDRRRFDDAV